MKKFFLIMFLCISFGCHTVPFVQPVFELGMICKDHIVGPLDPNAQLNSFIKGVLFGSSSTLGQSKVKKPQKLLPLTEKDAIFNTFYMFLPHTINILDFTKNHHSLCILTRAFGIYVGRRLIEKYFTK